MNEDRMQIEQKRKLTKYQGKGYKLLMEFDDEYVLLIDNSLNKILIYKDGTVWRTDPYGEYRRSI